MKFWLLTWPRNQVRKLAILENYFEEEEEEEEEEQQQQQQQQQPASAEVAITTMASKISSTALPSVFFSWPKGTVRQM